MARVCAARMLLGLLDLHAWVGGDWFGCRAVVHASARPVCRHVSLHDSVFVCVIVCVCVCVYHRATSICVCVLHPTPHLPWASRCVVSMCFILLHTPTRPAYACAPLHHRHACALLSPSPRTASLSGVGGWTSSGMRWGAGATHCLPPLSPPLDTRPGWLRARAHLHDPHHHAFTPLTTHVCA